MRGTPPSSHRSEHTMSTAPRPRLAPYRPLSADGEAAHAYLASTEVLDVYSEALDASADEALALAAAERLAESSIAAGFETAYTGAALAMAAWLRQTIPTEVAA